RRHHHRRWKWGKLQQNFQKTRAPFVTIGRRRSTVSKGPTDFGILTFFRASEPFLPLSHSSIKPIAQGPQYLTSSLPSPPPPAPSTYTHLPPPRTSFPSPSPHFLFAAEAFGNLQTDQPV